MTSATTYYARWSALAIKIIVESTRPPQAEYRSTAAAELLTKTTAHGFVTIAVREIYTYTINYYRPIRISHVGRLRALSMRPKPN